VERCWPLLHWLVKTLLVDGLSKRCYNTYIDSNKQEHMMIDRTPKEQISDQMTQEIQAARAQQVQDRKTGEFYNPQERFDQLMNKPEILAMLKRLAVR